MQLQQNQAYCWQNARGVTKSTKTPKCTGQIMAFIGLAAFLECLNSLKYYVSFVITEYFLVFL